MYLIVVHRGYRIQEVARRETEEEALKLLKGWKTRYPVPPYTLTVRTKDGELVLVTAESE